MPDNCEWQLQLELTVAAWRTFEGGSSGHQVLTGISK